MEANQSASSMIPGLPQAEVMKAAKKDKEKVDKQKKKEREKAAKLRKKMESDGKQKEYRREDFLSSSPRSNLIKKSETLEDRFQFSDFDEIESDNDAFEDSKEELSENEGNSFFTPVSLKSNFAKIIAKSAKTVPRSRSKSVKRPTSSPLEDVQKKVKVRAKSQLPVRSEHISQ